MNKTANKGIKMKFHKVSEDEYSVHSDDGTICYGFVFKTWNSYKGSGWSHSKIDSNKVVAKSRKATAENLIKQSI
jgi:hypothetical protein